MNVLAPFTLGLAASQDGHGGSFLDGLPDPMRPDLREIAAVIVLVTLLYWILRVLLFKPVTRTMDDREAAIQAGELSRQKAASEVEARQTDYQSRLQALRAQAFEQKKALAEAAAQERQRLVEEARTAAQAERGVALEALQAQREAARSELMSQVDTLSESMVQQLLKA